MEKPIGLETLNEDTLENMNENETNKYLGFQQTIKINQLKSEFKNRVARLLKTGPNSRNLTKADNTFAYSFDIIKWAHTDIDIINILIQTEFTKNRMSQRNACKERLTLERNQGSRGNIDISSLHMKQIQTLTYFSQNKQPNLHMTIVKADKNYRPLYFSNPNTADKYNHM